MLRHFLKIFLISSLSLTLGCSTDEIVQHPVMTIYTDGAVDWENYSKAVLRLSGLNEEWNSPIEIKKRGGFSRKFPKHSFTIDIAFPHHINEFNKYYDSDDWILEDDWVLNANYIDKSFIRHKLSYDLFNDLHPKNRAPKSAYVNLILNDEDLGLYLACEKLNSAHLIDSIQDGSMVFKEPPIFFEEKITFFKDASNYYNQRFPEKGDQDLSYLMDSLNRFLFHSSDELFEEQIEQWFDLGSIMDWHIILLLSNNSDGLLKNFFIYKESENAPFQFSIWDYDHSFGRDGDGEMNFLERLIDVNRNVLLKRLLNSKKLGYKSRLTEHWQSHRAGALEIERINNKVAEYKRILGSAIPKNEKIWPANSKHYYDAASFEEEIYLIMDYIPRRLNQLDKSLY